MNRRRAAPKKSPPSAKRAAAGSGLALRTRERFEAWREQHLYCLLSSLGRLWQRRMATILTTFVLAFAMCLPLAYYVMFRNAAHAAAGMASAREMGVFIKRGSAAPAVEGLAQQFRLRADVAAVDLRSPEQGLADLRALPGFDAALAELPANPLPPLMIVSPREGLDGSALAHLADDLRADPLVDVVQLDLSWRERLDRLLALAERAGRVLAVVFALGALLVVGNTVRLDVGQHADEIAILGQLGGTRGFVRRPYLYLGCWYGLAAAALALGVVATMTALLAGPVADLARSYGADFHLAGLDTATTLETLAGGIVLGWIGAFVATTRYLLRNSDR